MSEKTVRDMYWSEVDEEEKCERLRSNVKGLERDIHNLKEELRSLSRHFHVENGGIAVPYDRFSSSSLRWSADSEERAEDVYF